MEMKNKKPSHVQSVERAMILLNIMAAERSDMSLTDISRQSGWPKSTVYGLLSTLRDYRFAEQSAETGHYRLGARLFELGNVVAKSWDVCAIAKPHLRRLCESVGETVHLAMESDGEVLYLDKVEPKQLIRIVSEVGGRLPMHCSGLGKVLLAYMNEAEVMQVAEKRGLTQMTPRTITSLPKLFEELEKVRSQGYCMDNGEIMNNLRCVAAPIFDVYGAARYAVSVSGLDSNMRGEPLNRAIKQVIHVAGVISGAIGAKASSDA
ncbi:MAG: IclR family transcriptional regulator [Synergistaceae bacterium]|nr:IclR family transcriptional regulator [Synergistaceae bacterium]